MGIFDGHLGIRMQGDRTLRHAHPDPKLCKKADYVACRPPPLKGARTSWRAQCGHSEQQHRGAHVMSGDWMSSVCASSGTGSVLWSSCLSLLDHVPQSMWHPHLGAFTQLSVLINLDWDVGLSSASTSLLQLEFPPRECPCCTQPNTPLVPCNPWQRCHPAHSSLKDKTCNCVIISTISAYRRHPSINCFIHSFYFIKPNDFH